MMLQNHVSVREPPWPWCYGYLFEFSSGDLANTSSHMCGSWYLQIFLFRDGHLLLLILPLWWSWQCFGPPCPLYYYWQETVMTSDVMMVMDGWWSLHVFSEPLCKCSAWFPNVFFITVHPATPEPVDHTTLLQDGVSVFGVCQEVLDGIVSFEIHFYFMFLQLSPMPWMYGTTI